MRAEGAVCDLAGEHGAAGIRERRRQQARRDPTAAHPGGGEGGLEARPAAADHHKEAKGWTDLFNGRDLTGFSQKNGTATFEAKDGTIVGTTAKGSPNSFLCTDKLYGDFELTFEVKVHNSLNSGVMIRSAPSAAA